jgi:hypothetical protein
MCTESLFSIYSKFYFKLQFIVNTKIMATIPSPTKKLTPFLTTIKLGVALPNYKKISIDYKVNAKFVLN